MNAMLSKILALSTSLLLLSKVEALSFYNPWSVQIVVNARKGTSILAVLNQMRSDAGETMAKQMASEYHLKSSIVVSDDQVLQHGFVLCEDYNAKGEFGVLLTELLHSYGCVGNLEENEKGDSYTFTVFRRTPCSTDVVFLAVPDVWRDRIREIGLYPFMSEIGFEKKQFEKCVINMSSSFLAVWGRPEPCERMVFLSKEAKVTGRRPKENEQKGAG